ncbi:MAG TPA: AzlC family ABC transporter permease [Alphaproteobacteria bacterium]
MAEGGLRHAGHVSWRGVRNGFRRMLPLAIFVVPFGIAFGAAAIEKGVSPALAILMSALVFAGASQFSALDLWTAPLALIPILLTTFAVNARHLLLGAALYPWLSACPPRQRFAIVGVLSDPNWALATKAYESGERDAGFLVGSGIVLWIVWLAGTAIGALVGSDLGDLSRYGFDVLITVYFLTILIGLWRGRDDVLPWLAAAGAAVVAADLLPPGWYVVVGGLAGGIVGALRHDR